MLCVGLDPHASDLPEFSPESAKTFCLNLIAATHEFAAAYKPNSAFFEVFGPQGIKVLQEVIESIPAEIPVILDAKRGDIASTAQAYAHSVYKTLGAQAVTVSPYLGHDSLEPFLADPARGVFMLCKTSNLGSADVQDLMLSPSGLFVYEQIANLGQKWNLGDNLGLVVGATQPDALARVRELAPQVWILAPGVGAQGGDLEAALKAGLRSDGMGMLIPVSRAVSRAADPTQAAWALCSQINQIRQQVSSTQPTRRNQAFKERLMDDLLEAGCVKFGSFTLKSGLSSPIYMDLRELVSYPLLLAQIARAFGDQLEHLHFDRLAALPYAAIPIATAISLQKNLPMVYPRKEAKTYGTKVDIEGKFFPGETALIIDDLATTGESKFEAIEKLTSAGLLIQDVVVLIDRQSGAKEALAQRGYNLHAMLTLTEMLDHWEITRRVPVEQIAAARDFITRSRAAG